jgi:hypothetical protein
MREVFCNGCGASIDVTRPYISVIGTNQDSCSELACVTKMLAGKSASLCAACEKGTPYTGETAYLHNGKGETCSISDAELEASRKRHEEELERLRGEKPKRRGRPPKITPERAAELRAEADAAQEEARKQHPPRPVDEARKRTVEPPRWCRCGRPVTWTGKIWHCESGHENPLENLLDVKQGQPGERIDVLVADLEKAGLPLKLTEVVTWPVMRRDVARALILEKGDVPGWYESLESNGKPPAVQYDF